MKHTDLVHGDVIRIVKDSEDFACLIGNVYTVVKDCGNHTPFVFHNNHRKALGTETKFNKVGV